MNSPANARLGAAMAYLLDTQNPRKSRALVAGLCAVVMLSMTTFLLHSSGNRTELKASAKEDLSIFANSAPSYYVPGDTAADSDILPTQVLEDDGSTSDRTEALAASRRPGPDYARSHWYMHGQSKDFHGDLHQELTARKAHDRRREEEVQQASLRREEQERQRKAAEEEDRAREQSLTSIDAQSQRSTHLGGDSYAYTHPFAADHKGMSNLVVAEFKEDEERMKETNDAIFGNLKDDNKWKHGGLTLDSVYENPPTLHEDLERQKEAKLKQLSRFSSLSEVSKRPAKVAAAPAPAPAAAAVKCTIEMLENGMCSTEKHKASKAAVRSAMNKVQAEAKLLMNKAKKSELRSDDKAPAAAPAPAHSAALAVVQDQAPTAGSVISGWASDVGSLF